MVDNINLSISKNMYNKIVYKDSKDVEKLKKNKSNIFNFILFRSLYIFCNSFIQLQVIKM